MLSRRRLLAGMLSGALVDACDTAPKRAPSPAPKPSAPAAAEERTLTNVASESTRELFAEYNALFARQWLRRSGQKLTVKQSHRESAEQARAVIGGQEADVVALGLAGDVNAIAGRALIAENWQRRLLRNSSPFTSTVVLLVRKANPKQLRGFLDLAKPEVTFVAANPKTSSEARWSYLALWDAAHRQSGNSATKAEELVRKTLENARELAATARAATAAFVERKLGDALVTTETEALLAVSRHREDVAIVVPPRSILVELPVSIVDKVVDRRGTRELANAYVAFLYDFAAQGLAARHFFRPGDPLVAKHFAASFPELERFGVDEVFGGWGKAQAAHFDAGASFDRTK